MLAQYRYGPDQTRPDQDIPGQTIGICVYVTAPLSPSDNDDDDDDEDHHPLGSGFRGSGPIVQCGSEVEES